MNEQVARRRYVTLEEAEGRAASWARALWQERTGDADDEVLDNVARACVRRLRDACAAGEIATAACATPAEDDEAMLERGALHSWLATQAPEALCGRALPASAAPNAGAVTLLQAVQIEGGEGIGLQALRAGFARRAHQAGWRADHETGVALLSAIALQRIVEAAKDDEVRDDARVAFVDALQVDVLSGKRAVFARGHDGQMRQLRPSDWTADIVLDLASSRFMPHADLSIGSEERSAAQRACDAIGDVFVCSDVKASQAPRATVVSERGAEEALRDRVETWLASGGAMLAAPIKAHWIAGEGRQLARTKGAARRIWRKVVASDVRFAPLRRAGRRPREES